MKSLNKNIHGIRKSLQVNDSNEELRSLQSLVQNTEVPVKISFPFLSTTQQPINNTLCTKLAEISAKLKL